jgi:hypothetical protein
MSRPLVQLEYDVLPSIGEGTKVLPISLVVDASIYVATTSIAITDLWSATHL